MRILVDVDSTVADMLPEWLRRYNRDYNDTLTPQQVTAWDLVKFVKPECGNKIYGYLHDQDLYEDVQPYDGALFTIRELRTRGHEILFASAGVSGARPKYNWLLKWNFITTQDNPEAQFILIYRKELLDADLLIDDRDTNVIYFVAKPIRWGILMDQPWNLATQISPDTPIKRANSWQKVLNLIGLHELGYRKGIYA